MKYSKFIVICLALLMSRSLFSQTNGDAAIDVQKLVSIPASPEATGMVRYGETQVNHSLGRPNVSVPLYTHSGKEMSLSFLLNYDASGVKVDQLASNVGLGWTFVAGGSLVRRTLGLADDRVATKNINAGTVQSFINFSANNSISQGQPLDKAQMGNYWSVLADLDVLEADTQPDVFSFSTGTGLSGTIYVDYVTETAFCIEDPTLKITFTGGVLSPTSWIVTDASGSQYHFSVKETTSHTHTSAATQESTWNYTSAWQLAKIISPNKRDEYVFNYAPVLQWQAKEDLRDIGGRQNRPGPYGPGNSCSVISDYDFPVSKDSYSIGQYFLSSVSWNGNTIALIAYTSNREDLPDSKEISSVNFKNGTAVIKTANFNYSHFGNTAGGSSEIEKRLKLDKVTINGYPVNPEEKEVWSFEYNSPSSVPPRDSKDVDFWGYYNGASNNHLIPPGSYGSNNYGGANRNANLEKTAYGTLDKIYYPTGGYTEFFYENHVLDDDYTAMVNVFNNINHSVTAGSDSNDPYGYVFSEPSVPPKAITGTFQINRSGTGVNDPELEIDDSNTIEIKVGITGTTGSCLIGTNTTIYIFPDDANWDHAYAINQVALGNGVVVYRCSLGTETIPLTEFDQGTYRYLVYNANGSSIATVKSVRDQKFSLLTNNITVGGLRVNKIENHLEDGSLASAKTFEYQQAMLHEELNFDKVKIDSKMFYDPVTQGRTEYTCETYYRFENNQNSSPGHAISYGLITEKAIDGNDLANGKTEYTYRNSSYVSGANPFIFQSPLSGKLLRTEVYNQDGERIQKTENFYSQNKLSSALPAIKEVKGAYLEAVETVTGYRMRQELTSSTEAYYLKPWVMASDSLAMPGCGSANNAVCLDGIWPNYSVYHYSMDVYFAKLDRTVSTTYENPSMITETFYEYNETTNFQIKEQRVKDSNGADWINKYFYPDDLQPDDISTFPNEALSSFPGPDIETSEETAIKKLKANHQINTVIQTEKHKNNIVLSRQRTNYELLSGDLVLPKSMETSKSTDPMVMEKRVEYHAYDAQGNPLEVSQEGGSHISYIWGYNSSLPVIQGMNIDHSNLQSAVTWALSNMVNIPLGVTDLETLLEYIGPMTAQGQIDAWGNFNSKLREHSSITTSVMLTSMAYNAVKGMLAQTDPNGLHTFYEYDSMGRLKRVRDNDGNVIQTYKYNFKGQE
tara:strand:+ start:1846 stop:5415 length:3570 start_codon:yes stop_codon:yes gene_type:complete